MVRIPIRLAFAALPFALTGCVSASDNYPSLALRDAERAYGSAEAVEAAAQEPPPAAPVSESLAGKIDRLVADARAAHRDFTANRAGTASIVSAARGSRSPADVWIRAQVALAGLQALRSAAVIAQAQLDLLYADERIANSETMTPSAEALAQAREQVDAWVASQDDTIARLSGQLSG